MYSASWCCELILSRDDSRRRQSIIVRSDSITYTCATISLPSSTRVQLLVWGPHDPRTSLSHIQSRFLARATLFRFCVHNSPWSSATPSSRTFKRSPLKVPRGWALRDATTDRLGSAAQKFGGPRSATPGGLAADHPVPASCTLDELNLDLFASKPARVGGAEDLLARIPTQKAVTRPLGDFVREAGKSSVSVRRPILIEAIE